VNKLERLYKMIFKKNKNKNKVAVQANAWLMKIKSDTMTARDRGKFEKWLKKDPEHQAEFDLMDAIWGGVDVLKDEPAVILERNQWLANERLNARVKPKNILGIPLPIFKYAAFAVSLVLVVMVTWLMKDTTPSDNNYTTATGEQRTIYLADGSSISMDTETMISYLYSTDLRSIVLKKGRALFSVAHDTERPFVVSAGKITVQAIGTQFNVYRKLQGTTSVAVSEGKILIKQKAKDQEKENKNNALPAYQNTEPAISDKQINTKKIINLPLIQETLVAGQSIEVNENISQFVIGKIYVQKVNDWRQGRLHFNEESLQVVINEINRYLDKKIVINDARLQHIPISINFDVKHRKSFLNALKNIIPITSRSNINGDIVLSFTRDKA